VATSAQEINNTRSEMKQMFTTLESQVFLDQFNQIMDKLNDVKILGDKGIDITYTLDKNGYVISTKGDIEFVVDMAKLGKIFGESASDGIPTGKYTVGINFEVNNSNINGKVNITLPTLTSANSFNYSKLFDEPISQPIKVISSAIKSGKTTNNIVTHTVTGGQLPKTSTHLYELLLIGAVLTLLGALGLRSRKAL